MNSLPNPSDSPACALTWFEAWVATLPPNQVRTVTAADGSTRFSIELRDGAKVDALRDAMRIYHTPDLHFDLIPA